MVALMYGMHAFRPRFASLPISSTSPEDMLLVSVLCTFFYDLVLSQVLLECT